MNETETGDCALCGRWATTLSEHHLIPRATHRNKRVRKMFGVDEMKTRKLGFCHPCHKGVHIFFTEKELALEYNTVELLLAESRVAKHVEWVKGLAPDFKLKGGRLRGGVAGARGNKVGKGWHKRFRARGRKMKAEAAMARIGKKDVAKG